MAQIEWKQLNNPNFSASNALAAHGADRITSGIDGLRKLADDRNKFNATSYQTKVDNDTDNFISQLTLASQGAVSQGRNPNDDVAAMVKDLQGKANNIDMNRVNTTLKGMPLDAVTFSKAHDYFNDKNDNVAVDTYFSSKDFGLSSPKASKPSDAANAISALTDKYNSSLTSIESDSTLTDAQKRVAAQRLQGDFNTQGSFIADTANKLGMAQLQASTPWNISTTGSALTRNAQGKLVVKPVHKNAIELSVLRSQVNDFKNANPLADGVTRYSPEQVSTIQSDLLAAGANASLVKSVLNESSSFKQPKSTTSTTSGSGLPTATAYDVTPQSIAKADQWKGNFNTFKNDDGTYKPVPKSLANFTGGTGKESWTSDIVTRFDTESREMYNAAKEIDQGMANLGIVDAKAAGASGINTTAEFKMFKASMPVVDFSGGQNMVNSLAKIERYYDLFNADTLSKLDPKYRDNKGNITQQYIDDVLNKSDSPTVSKPVPNVQQQTQGMTDAQWLQHQLNLQK
ncbi:hypothetical protein C9I87_09105 [Photobacterium iliopiscarium]|uniref:hypothetical protein n=1 Tax=Photobacterium iliopiscarium TaxID=56192 RepID=UPI000D15EA21|nr:hypothetical protein [Photobacterium iliopiscarium]PST95418.1 hypothetical protein C9I87_09105 [Photobacterium iliopiscarium]